MEKTTATTAPKTPKARQCNLYPAVWAAIYGCDGVGTFAGYDRVYTSNGLAHPIYACPVCRAVKASDVGLKPYQHQERLVAAQAAAGVADYRTARVKRLNGRPVIDRG